MTPFEKELFTRRIKGVHLPASLTTLNHTILTQYTLSKVLEALKSPFQCALLEIPQNLQYKFFALNFLLSLLLSLFSNYELILYFCFCSFFHSYGSFNHDIFNILDLLWVSSTLFIHIFTLFMYRKSFCTFICQVSPLTSSCQFSSFHQASLLPQASLSFIWHPFIKLP